MIANIVQKSIYTKCPNFFSTIYNLVFYLFLILLFKGFFAHIWALLKDYFYKLSLWRRPTLRALIGK